MTNWISLEQSLKGRANAVERERERIIALLKEQGVIRNCSATNKLVYVHSNSLEVLYLKGLTDNNE